MWRTFKRVNIRHVRAREHRRQKDSTLESALLPVKGSEVKVTTDAKHEDTWRLQIYASQISQLVRSWSHLESRAVKQQMELDGCFD